MIFLRSLAFNLWFFTLTVILGVYGLYVRWFAPHKSLDLAMFWAGLVLWGLRHICGIQTKITGLEHLPPEGPALIAAQHQSAFDCLIWLRMVPRACYVMKEELRRIPLFGPLLKPAGQIMVKRDAGASAMRSLLREGERACKDNHQIIIFPEGTRAAPGERLELQPGVLALARQLRRPVIPVATDSGLHWGRNAFRKHPGVIHVAIQPPLLAGLDRAALAQAIRHAWDSAKLEP